MLNWNMLLLTAALAATPASAVDAPTNVSTVSATGEGSWEVICHVGTVGGEDSPWILNNRRTSFSVAGARAASCAFTKPSRSALTISIESTTLLCPFKSAAPDACKQTFEKGAAGSFDIKQKARR